jgi:hypothetical protein
VQVRLEGDVGRSAFCLWLQKTPILNLLALGTEPHLVLHYNARGRAQELVVRRTYCRPS